MVISINLSIWGPNFGLFDRKSEHFLRAGEPKPRSCRGVPRQDPGSQGRVRAQSAGRPWLTTAMMAAPLWLMLSGGMWENTRWKLFEASFDQLSCTEFRNSSVVWTCLNASVDVTCRQQRSAALPNPAELRNSLRWRGTVFGRLWCFTWIAFQTGYGSLKGQWILRSCKIITSNSLWWAHTCAKPKNLSVVLFQLSTWHLEVRIRLYKGFVTLLIFRCEFKPYFGQGSHFRHPSETLNFLLPTASMACPGKKCCAECSSGMGLAWFSPKVHDIILIAFNNDQDDQIWSTSLITILILTTM